MKRLLITALLLVACRSDEVGDDASARSVILITIDTLRADHVSTYGYFRRTTPNIDEFARGAILFENAVTPMATTLPAHTSILTGTRPRQHSITRNGLVFESEDGLRTVTEMLKDAGYQTSAVVSASPLAVGTGISIGFDHYVDPKDGPRLAAKTTDLALKAVDDLDEKKPFFVWIHYWDPHDPYDPPAPYNAKFKKTEALKKHIEGTNTKLVHTVGRLRFDVMDIYNKYDGEIVYTDAEVGRFLAGLRERGLFDTSAVVLTADHGEGLWQHDWHDHGRIFNEEIFVPLVIKPPADLEMPPGRVERVATTIDIFPTLSRMLSLPLPPSAAEQFEGIDVMNADLPRTHVLSERVNRHREGWEPGDKYAVTGLDYKLFVLSKGEPQLFDMQTDRLELIDLHKERPAVTKKMKRQFFGTMAGYVKTRRTRKGVSPELVEKLRALGYVQ